jgi:uncharacterized protein YdaU (DUF1376 family)
MKAPAFQFYADDFIGGTVCFTAEDVGAYMRLLCFQWGNGALPAKKELLDRIAGCVVSDDVMAKFPEGKNPRKERERLKQAAYRAERSESGKKGAKSKWANGSANGSAIKEPMANAWPPSPSPSPSPISVSDSDSNSFQPEEPPTASAKPKGVVEGKNSDRLPLSDQSKRFAAIMGRRLTTEWSEDECAAYRKLGTVAPDDLALVERFYTDAKGKPDAYLRTSMLTFVRHFRGEVDKANKWFSETAVTTSTTEKHGW